MAMLRPFLRAARVPAAVARPPAAWAAVPRSARWYSEKKDKDQKPESLLNEDLLAKAGMDVGGEAKESAAHEEGTRERSEEEKKQWAQSARKPSGESSTMQKRTNRGFKASIVLVLLGAGLAFYSTRPFDDEEKKSFPGVDSASWSPSALWQRFRARTGSSLNYFSEPAFEKLLPDALPPPYGRPMTLVLALDDLLVKSEWTREHGWRTAKRPGVDYFLVYLAQYYEIVIFTDKYQMFDEEIVMKLDPYRAAISYALFREATRYQDGKVVKDLSHLNRDLSKVVAVDVKGDSLFLQPDNALILPPWKGNADDDDLIRLIPLLEWIGAQPVKDVRPILKSFRGGNVLDEFEQREKIAREKWSQTAKSRSGGGGAWASSLLGVAGKNDPSMMPQDYIRQEGQRGYAQFQKLIEEQGEKMLQEEKQREKELMDRHKMTISKYMTQGGPTQEEIAATMAQMEADAKHTASTQKDIHEDSLKQ